MPPPSPLAKKLQIKPGNHVLVLDAPAGFLEALAPLPDGASTAHAAKGHFDMVQLFAKDMAAFEKRVEIAARSMKPGGILWVAWPKASKLDTDLSRDILLVAAQHHGLRAVASVSLDETWSALRFKPA
ncbi:MAG TPA: DUF3052 domain-containing protein [Dehalococcoidia bacterium]